LGRGLHKIEDITKAYSHTVCFLGLGVASRASERIKRGYNE